MAKYTMGIRGLSQLLAETCPEALKAGKLSDLAGWTVAIDGNLMANQMIRVGARIVNSRGEHINHLQGSMFRLINVMEAGIRPIVVIDGKPPALKARVLETRREARAPDAPKVSSQHMEQLQHLLSLMGVATLNANGEAEAAAARLRSADAVATDDLDALVFGAKTVIRGLSSGEDITIISREQVLQCLGLTQSQFVDLCLLCGGDYLVGIPNVGPKRALELIRAYKSLGEVINRIRSGEVTRQLPEDYPWEVAKELYVNPEVGGVATPRHKPNYLAVQEFLVGRGLDVSRVSGAVRRLEALTIRTKERPPNVSITAPAAAVPVPAAVPVKRKPKKFEPSSGEESDPAKTKPKPETKSGTKPKKSPKPPPKS